VAVNKYAMDDTRSGFDPGIKRLSCAMLEIDSRTENSRINRTAINDTHVTRLAAVSSFSDVVTPVREPANSDDLTGLACNYFLVIYVNVHYYVDILWRETSSDKNDTCSFSVGPYNRTVSSSLTMTSL